MIHALGVSHTEFDAASPGRLCRGRERWIEPYDLEGSIPLHRLVISGATFTDDSAADALRGLPHSKLDLAAVLHAVFPRRQLLAFMEDGHPADIPDGAEAVELYEGHRAGGRSGEVFVRWVKRVGGIREIREVLGEDPYADRVRGFAVITGDEDLEALLDKIFLFTGMSTVDSPPARFQPSALGELLELVPAVAILHRDKHGPAVGVYSRDPLEPDARLVSLCEKQETLFVPFAIPPMLARWDRALAELRSGWHEAHDEEFPVPPAPEPSQWSSRRRRKKKRTRGSDEE